MLEFTRLNTVTSILNFFMMGDFSQTLNFSQLKTPLDLL